MTNAYEPVVHRDDAEEHTSDAPHYTGAYRVLNPGMRGAGGKLGLIWNRLEPGSCGCPFHTHALEDEVFFVLEGTGVLRYGDALYELRPGSAVSCPAGSGVAHQIANTGDVDLVYLAAGPYEPNEVCTYPDSGKVMVRSLRTVGRLEGTDYMDGEEGEPPVFGMAREREGTEG